MRAVVQRVKQASVSVDGNITGRIEQGLLVFLGVGPDDGPMDAAYITDKIANLRVFADDGGKMNRSVLDIAGGILLISQFTLFGDCRKGRRPDFSQAAPPALAKALYEQTIETLRGLGITVQTGIFAADMQIDSVNDGPVTMLLDSKKLF
ncbi:MAG: D-aminoacyl-tRNA deacylase [Anaerohalosphaeraceae bacterium]